MMNYSLHLWHKALRELMTSEYGGRRMRLQVLIIFSFIALLLLGPMAFESEQNVLPISARAEKEYVKDATVKAEPHRKAVFDERKRAWDERKDSRDTKIAGGKDGP
jgi:hypothetical protein